MEINKQNQTAGDNAQQVQVGNATNLTIINGITEKRAREIFCEMNEIARKDYTVDAYETAWKRVSMFESLLMDKVQKVDGMLEAFGDPSFQYLLADAQRRVAASERLDDYARLAELLECRVKQGANRKIRTGISQAVKIVDEIDDDALCGLTASHAVWRLYPLSGCCSEGLDTINDCYANLLYQPLPNGREWLEHLEILNAVRCTPIAGIRKFESIHASQLAGYVCVGIKKDSDAHKAAQAIITSNKLPTNVLIDHEWNKGYVRLSVPHIEYIDHLRIGTSDGDNLRALTSEERGALHDIWKLYSQDAEAMSKVQERFAKELQKRPNISVIQNWWNSMPYAFNLTHIGVVLAHANAQQHGVGIGADIIL